MADFVIAIKAGALAAVKVCGFGGAFIVVLYAILCVIDWILDLIRK